MKYLILAVVVGVLTIGVSVFVLSDSDSSYETDSVQDREISLNEKFVATNYDIESSGLECREFESIDLKDARYGCVLSIALTNTSVFEQVINLDGDELVSTSGSTFPSSHELSRQYIESNGLLDDIDVGETIMGGIFFEVPEGEVIEHANIYESTGTRPIVILL